MNLAYVSSKMYDPGFPEDISLIFFTAINACGLRVKYAVINIGFKLVGFVTGDDVFIPLFSTQPMTLRDRKADKLQYVYVNEYPFNLNPTTIQDDFDQINEFLPAHLHRSLSEDEKFTMTPDGRRQIITHDEYIIDADIFVGMGSDDTDSFDTYITSHTKSLMKRQNELERVAAIISSNGDKTRELYMLKHPLNPFTDSVKRELFKDRIVDTSSLIIDEFLRKSVESIQHSRNYDKGHHTTEIEFTQDEATRGIIERIRQQLKNKYKITYNSSEDFFTNIHLIPAVLEGPQEDLNVDLRGSAFSPINPIKTWGKQLKDYHVNVPDDYSNDWLINVFMVTGNRRLGYSIFTKDMLQMYVERQRKNDYDANPEVFIDIQKTENPTFVDLFVDVETDYVKLQSVFQHPDYLFSRYEIRKLATLTGINVVFIPYRQTTQYPDGIDAYMTNEESTYAIPMIKKTKNDWSPDNRPPPTEYTLLFQAMTNKIIDNFAHFHLIYNKSTNDYI
jgi:hypothetical protein